MGQKKNLIMSLRFTALEIGSGDAFLLEDSDKNWNCLFDAGGSKNKIISLLKRKGINRINLAICSHNDIDHANGFIGLLKSDLDIDEIWLPGTWSSVLKYVRDNGIGPEEIKCMVNVEHEYKERNLEDTGFLNADGSIIRLNEMIPLLDPKSIEPIEDFDDNLSVISEAVEQELHRFSMAWWSLYDEYYWLRSERKMEAKQPLLLLALDKIIQIGGLAYRKGCKIRWFDSVGSCKIKNMDYGFVALNSSEIVKVQKPKDAYSFSLLCCLTVENVYSMVFEYRKNGIPIIRFSADSDCTAQSTLYNGAIVTAPHHGSEANANVYGAIKGKDIIWVRSDRKSSKRPCPDFKALNNKYCLACYKNNTKCEICFEFNGNQWEYRNGIRCTCKP